MSKGRRVCVFCGGPANSAEHIFKRGLKKRLAIVDPVERAFGQVDGNGDFTMRPDPQFDLKVRRVCRVCNNGWMNSLDLHVEEWIANPDDHDEYWACDPKDFRRWAVKLALMRSLIDNPSMVPRDFYTRLHRGDDLKEWHVFVGRAAFKEYRHAFAGVGIGRGPRENGLGYGILHASWALGKAVVSAVCIPGGDPEKHFFPSFRDYNSWVDEPLVEIPFGASELPDVFAHRKLAPFQTEPFFMFFTPADVSPIASQMHEVYDLVRMTNSAHDLSGERTSDGDELG